MIRPARTTDLEQVLNLLKSFAQESLINYSEWTEEDLSNAKKVLLNLIVKEYLMVAEKDNKLIGMIGAQREPDPWIKNRRRLRELFWWVDPEHRRSKLSAKLFLTWQQDCERMLRDKIVDQASLSTQPGRSDISLDNRGWICVEQHWIKG
jgi:N-acetylglutamate synthase-like GNAT family acetyltransferase